MGKTLEELVTPAVMCMLESLAASETGVSWLAKRRTVEVKKPVLVKNDGACMLSFTEVVPVSSKQERLAQSVHSGRPLLPPHKTWKAGFSAMCGESAFVVGR